MARPIIEGLDYFPQDVDFYDDPKIMFIEEKHGLHGGYIANRLLCWIYRNGYYATWDVDMSVVFARRVGNSVTSSLVHDVVNSLVNRGFFDKTCYEKHGILTSRGIQKRWIRITKDAKRKAVINADFDLIDSRNSEFLPEETVTKRELITQSKAKQSKTKQSRPTADAVEATPPPTSIPVIGINSLLKSIDVLKDECLKDEVNFVDHACRQLKTTREKIPGALEQFNGHLKAMTIMAKAVPDYRKHFVSWARKNPDCLKVSSTQKGTTPGELLSNLGL